MARHVQVLRVDLPEDHVDTLVNTANRAQSEVHFEHLGSLAFQRRGHTIRRDSYDLDVLLKASFTTREGKRIRGSRDDPVVIVTGLPYGEREASVGEELTGFGSDDRFPTAIVSSGLWERVRRSARIGDRQPYLLVMLATFVLSWWADLDFHVQTRGCLFDRCDKNADVRVFFDSPNAFLCDRCFRDLEQAMSRGMLSLQDVVAARRLVAAARGRRGCFVAMPFSAQLEPVFEIVKSEFEPAGWQVVRSDQLRRPRDILGRIVLEILASDLVIAEVSRNNPNVFYEVGYADAARGDLLLLSRPRRLPFDLATRHTTFYTGDSRGLRRLRAALRAEARSR